jgi:hypothetical protein
MDNLLGGLHPANRALFQFVGPDRLNSPANNRGVIAPGALPAGQLSLSGPAEVLDAAHWPVRGDLAHIALAGRCFVPHYAVPMPHKVVEVGASLRRAARDDAEELILLPAGAVFDVLDMAGGWCWGQAGDGGFVGYIRQAELESVA